MPARPDRSETVEFRGGTTANGGVRLLSGCAILGSRRQALDERVVEVLRGYARTDEFLEEKRIERLKKMSVAESRAIFDELVAVGQKQVLGRDESPRLFQWRLETLIAVRRSFAALAEARGHI
jgi:hypothetical protein